MKIVGPRLDWEGAGVGLGKGFEPGEDILESSEGGRRLAHKPKRGTHQARHVSRQVLLQADPTLWAQLY